LRESRDGKDGDDWEDWEDWDDWDDWDDGRRPGDLETWGPGEDETKNRSLSLSKGRGGEWETW